MIPFFSLDNEMKCVFLKAGGLENNGTINGTVIEQISRSSVVTPDLLNDLWVTEMYGVVMNVVLQLFLTLSVIWCILFIVSRLNLDYNTNATAILFMNRGIIALVMIYGGLPIIAMLLNLNNEISSCFGGAANITAMLMTSLTSPLGAIIVGFAMFGALYLGLFYLVRLFLIYLSCGIWAVAWLLWFAGGGAGGQGRFGRDFKLSECSAGQEKSRR